MTAPDPRAEPRRFLEHLYQAAVRRALPLHNTAFLPDEQAPVVAAAVHAAVIERYLMNA